MTDPMSNPGTANRNTSAAFSADVAGSSHAPDDLVLVAYISGAFGIQGWVKLKTQIGSAIAADAADALFAVRNWWLTRPDQALEPAKAVQVVAIKAHSTHLAAQLLQITTREAAQALQGQQIWIRRSDFPALAEGEYYWVDLLGLTVVNRQQELLGVVQQVIDNGAHPILQVSVATAADSHARLTPHLIPVVPAFIDKVDLLKRMIAVDWGLDF